MFDISSKCTALLTLQKNCKMYAFDSFFALVR